MSVIIMDGAGDRYEVLPYGAEFTLKPLDRPIGPIRVDSAQLRDFGVEWDGRELRPRVDALRRLDEKEQRNG